jgi:hypothetical protein
MAAGLPGKNAMRLLKTWIPLLAMLLVLGGCATSPSRGDALQEAQYAWSAAIRWGDFEGAWNMVDPKVRAEHPLTDLEFARYKQVQISQYRELGTRNSEDASVREIQLGVVNRNSLAERQIRYTEVWHYEQATKTWWVTSGLPDLWATQ